MDGACAACLTEPTQRDDVKVYRQPLDSFYRKGFHEGSLRELKGEVGGKAYASRFLLRIGVSRSEYESELELEIPSAAL